MPTYEYACRACGHEFELFQSMTAPVKKKCPECGKLKLERLIGTGAGVIFKGSGFYETDYRSESYKKAAEAEKKGADDGKAKDSKKADGGGETKSTSESTSTEKKSEPKVSKKKKKSPSKE